jgi:hypothetical protein
MMSAIFDADNRDDHGRDDSLLVEWAAEFAVRIRDGQSVDWEALAREHPERADALRRMLPAFALMAQMGSSAHGKAAPPDPDPIASFGCLGDFELLREVGRGGMGVVYEAHQISLNRRVAVKVLPFAHAMDSRQLERFRIEAQAAAALHHKNIVPVFSVSTEAGVPFYAMQFIEGRSLAELIRELRGLEGLEPTGPATACVLNRSMIAGQFAGASGSDLPADRDPSPGETTSSLASGPTRLSAASSALGRAFIRTVAALGIQASDALEHAHRRGIWHRDIKPSNLLVDEAGHLGREQPHLDWRRDGNPAIHEPGTVAGKPPPARWPE